MSRLQGLIAELCPDGVEYKRVDQVVTIRNGSDHKHLGDGDIPVYGSGGVMRYADTASYEGPSVLLPRKGSVDKVYFVDEPFWNVDTVFHTIIDETQVDPKFFYYLMVNAHLEQYSTSAARPSLTQRVLNKVVIPVPPIEVQREVVRVLDEYTAAHDELVKQLEEEMRLREQQQLLTQQNLMLFEDEVRSIPIGELADVSSGATPSRKNKSNFAGTIPWVKTGEVASGDITETEEHISEEALASTACKLYKEGTVLIAMYGQGDTRGKASMLRVPAATNQACAALVFHEGVDPEFALRQIQLRYNELRELSNKGGGQSNLSLGIIKKILLKVPSLNIQREFVSRYDDLKHRGIGELLDSIAGEIKLQDLMLTLLRNQLLSFPEKVA